MDKVKTTPVLAASPKIKPVQLHAAAFLLPLLGLALGFAAVGVWPFGENFTLTLDLKSQYISFLAYLRDSVLLGGGDFSYTFAKALGGDMAGFSAYYLLSPFNLLLLFFPTAVLPMGVTLITLLKVGCCGLAMSLLLCERETRVETLLFSVPYALMDFVIAFHFNIMWLDSVALLPLVVLGIRRLHHGKGPALYVCSLAGAIVCNYYIGYMICLFSLLYFAVLVLFFEKPPLGGWGQKGGLKPVWRFFGASALAGGLGAAVLVPTALSLSGGKAGFLAERFFDPSYASFADVISRYMPGTASAVQVFFGYPAIYCGMLALLCAVLFFTNRWVPRRARIGGGLLLGVLLLSFCVGPLDRVWHGLNKPVGFLYRYSFLFSFVLLYLGWWGFTQLRGRMVGRDMPIVLGACLVAMLLARREAHSHLTLGKLALGFAIAAAFAVLLWLFSKKKWRYSLFLLMLLVLADMGANLYLSLRQAGYTPLAEYKEYVENEKPIVQSIQAGDDGFYRLEKTYGFSDNDAFLLGYNGLTHFSSADKLFVREFLEDMGLSDGGYGVKYADGTTVALESLLGMKYLVTGGGGTAKPYTLIEEINGRLVWQNLLALPVGFLTGEGVEEFAFSGEATSLFEQYNALWAAVDPAMEGPLYQTVTSAERVPMGVNVREFEDETLYEKLEEDARVEFHIMAESDDMLYALFTTQNDKNADLVVNGINYGRFLFNDRHGVIALGRFAPGEVVTVALAPNDYEVFVESASFAHENSALLQESVARLRAGGYDLTAHSQSSFDGVVNNGSGGQSTLLLSIPYDKGWTARVDGQKVETRPALGALTSISVPDGAHQITLRYTPPGLWAGAAVTLASLAALLLWCVLRHRKGSDGSPKI